MGKYYDLINRLSEVGNWDEGPGLAQNAKSDKRLTEDIADLTSIISDLVDIVEDLEKKLKAE